MSKLSNAIRRGKPKKPNLKLPNRWNKFTTMGKVVPGTKFLPFKTPLKEEICQRCLGGRPWFTPAILLEQAPNLKLIIDLTQTDRFYDRQFFDDKGVRHHKIYCPGGGNMPSKEIIQEFSQIIKDFLASEDGQNEDSLIGVHCTHGLNRTGYLICKYMVENDGFSPKDAITAFEEARGHTIERKLYTFDLYNRTTVPASGFEKNQFSSRKTADVISHNSNTSRSVFESNWKRSNIPYARGNDSGRESDNGNWRSGPRPDWDSIHKERMKLKNRCMGDGYNYYASSSYYPRHKK